MEEDAFYFSARRHTTALFSILHFELFEQRDMPSCPNTGKLRLQTSARHWSSGLQWGCSDGGAAGLACLFPGLYSSSRPVYFRLGLQRDAVRGAAGSAATRICVSSSIGSSGAGSSGAGSSGAASLVHSLPDGILQTPPGPTDRGVPGTLSPLGVSETHVLLKLTITNVLRVTLTCPPRPNPRPE